MYIINDIYKKTQKSYEIYKIKTIDNIIQKIRVKNLDISKKEFLLSEKETKEYYSNFLWYSLLLFILIFIWIWALIMLVIYAKLMKPWELLLMLILQFLFGLSFIVLLYIYLVVKNRSEEKEYSIKKSIN